MSHDPNALLKGAKAEIERLIQQRDFAKAGELLQKIVLLETPAARPYVQWAEEMLVKIRTRTADAGQAALLKTIRDLMERADYDQAFLMLEGIPADQRTPQTRELLEEVQEVLRDLDELRNELRAAAQLGDCNEVERVLKAILEIKPNDRQAQKLLDKLRNVRRGNAHFELTKAGEVAIYDDKVDSHSALGGLAVLVIIGLLVLIGIPVGIWFGGPLIRQAMETADNPPAPRPQPLPAPNPVQPEQNAPPAQKMDWGQVADPNGDTEVIAEGKRIRFKMGLAQHDMSIEVGKADAPRILAPVTGDFTVQVKVSNFSAPAGNSTTPGRPPFVGAGLLLFSDEGNYIRLERASFTRGQTSLYTGWELRQNRQLTRPGIISERPLRGPETWLKIERRGNQCLGYISEDGNRWDALPPLSIQWQGEVQVGILACNNATEPFEPVFEDFAITQ